MADVGNYAGHRAPVVEHVLIGWEQKKLYSPGADAPYVLGDLEDCVPLGSTAVYRRLMDPSLDSCSSVAPGYSREHYITKEATLTRARLVKSESEDSGVELLPHSPFDSESSYSHEESESLDTVYSEEAEHLKGSAHEEPDSLRESSSEETDILEVHLKPQSIKVQRTLQRRDTSGLPHKLEQAVLRSRRQRGSSRESTLNRKACFSRQYSGSLKEQCSEKPPSHRTKSPSQSISETEKPDPLLLPGDGLKYLDNLCHMLEQIAELQQRNQRLQLEKKQAEERLHNRVMFVDSCQCGSSHSGRALKQDTPDGRPNARSWERQNYRKRSSSHTGILANLPQQPVNSLTGAQKMESHFVSVPNLQEDATATRHRSFKVKVSQWEKVKSLLSKLAQKAPGPTAGPAPKRAATTCRSQTLDGSSHAPRRLFFPGLVIRPSQKKRQHFL
ncbi:uncharacterized protein C8orf58 homolog [Pelodytes ibericus]